MLKANRVKEAFGKSFWLGAAIFATSFFVSAASAVPVNTTERQNTRARFSVGIDPILNVTIPDRYDFEIRSDSILHSAEFTFNVTTNHVTGYTAYASVANTDFVKSDDNTIVIPTIPENAPNLTEDFPLNHWALRFPAEDNDTFLPATTNMRIEKVTTPVQDHAVSTIVGARVNGDTPAGQYLCVINYQVTANVVPDTIRSIEYMQQMSPEVATSMQEDTSYQLRDNRDGKPYWIMKHDGQIIMEQNLDLELINDISGGTPEYTVLRPASSNVEQERVMTLIEPWGSSDSEIYYHAGGDYYYPEGYKPVVETDDLSPYSEDFKFSAGSYYPWNSATAGTGAAIATTETNAAESICPSSWRLPTPDEAIIISRPVVRSGRYDSATGNILGIYDGADPTSGNLYLWTSSTGTTAGTAKYFLVTSSSVTVQEGALTDGYSVRCIADAPNAFNLTFDANGGSNAPSAYSRVSWDESFEYSIEFGSGNVPTQANKDFIGWARTSDATMPEFTAASDVITLVPGTPTTLYAVWRTPCNPSATTISQAVCLQDVNSTVAGTISNGTQYQLIDYRDGKNYWITKVDGQVWMAQNLDFEIPAKGITLAPDMSDVTENRTLIVAEENGIRYKDGGDFFFAGGKTKTDTTSLLDNDPSWSYHAGSFYSWDAATAGAGATNGNSTESICPKGWTIPSATAWATLLTQTGHTQMDATNVTSISEENTSITFVADLDMDYLYSNSILLTLAGYGTEYGRIILPGSSTRYWASNEVNENHARAVSLYHSGIEQLLQNLENENKNSHFNVRCVLK